MEKFIQKLKKLKNLNFILLLLLPNLLWANVSMTHNPVPGGVVVVDFRSTYHAPSAFFGTVPLFVQRINNNHWQALVGIPLLESPGDKHILVKDSVIRKITFNVKPYDYKTQHITLTGMNKQYVTPSQLDRHRIKYERPVLTAAKKIFSRLSPMGQSFILPVKGPITSEFGYKRIYNGVERLPHTGIDIAAPKGTPVVAMADGNVILASRFFFNGRTVFIDHGKGLISAYMHLNKITVFQGQPIKQGATLGTVGQTGRATGAHLHFSVYLNRTAINPNLLITPQK